MKGIKVKQKAAFFEGLITLLYQLFKNIPVSEDDKLVFACLQEVYEKVQIRTVRTQDEYSIRFTVSQSIALSIFFSDYINEYKSYMGNKLHEISNEVKQKYQ